MGDTTLRKLFVTVFVAVCCFVFGGRCWTMFACEIFNSVGWG